MKAVRLTPDKQHAIVDGPAPVPTDSEVLVRPEYNGICGTDLHAADISLFRPGVIVGHEFSGEIVAIGGNVKGWAVGQKVVVNPNGHVCGECASCRAGRFNQCPVATQERPAGVVRHGGMAELVALHPAYLNAIPNGLDTRRAAWTEPLAVALRTVRTSPIRVGDTAVVIGGGPIGQLVIQLLARSGAGRITLIQSSR
jgi:threonine dehydrogenase-like Zn-dependent dehydrogenase